MLDERTGTWVLYNGKEYQLLVSPGKLFLKSTDKSAEKSGFTRYEDTGIWKKEIQPNEIKAACTYVPYAKYHGKNFSIADRNERDELLLVSDQVDANFAKQHGFSAGTSSTFFEKWVQRSELDDYFTVKGTFRKYKLL